MPAHLPQTPQAAEFFAWAVAARATPDKAPEAEIVSDCAAVVRLSNRPVCLQLNPRARYAAIMLYGQTLPARPVIRTTKAAGHQSINDASPGIERTRAIGNDHADKGANLRGLMHPQPEESVKNACFHDRKCAEATCAVAAVLFPVWPLRSKT